MTNPEGPNPLRTLLEGFRGRFRQPQGSKINVSGLSPEEVERLKGIRKTYTEGVYTIEEVKDDGRATLYSPGVHQAIQKEHLKPLKRS